MKTDTYTAVRACAIVLLSGLVLSASDVTAGNGLVIDWRTQRNGATLLADADPFDSAALFVDLVGPSVALAAAAKIEVVDGAPEVEEPAPRVHAYMRQANGGRLRAFEVGAFKVMVEAHEDDAAQAAFVERLAVAAMGVV